MQGAQCKCNFLSPCALDSHISARLLGAVAKCPHGCREYVVPPPPPPPGTISLWVARQSHFFCLAALLLSAPEAAQ